MKAVVPPLDGTNYPLWRTKMTSYLQSKALYKYLTRRVELLKIAAKRERKLKKLEQLNDNDEKALGLIKCNIADCYYEIVIDCKTAFEAWTSLENYFAGKEQSNRVNLLEQAIDGRLVESSNPTMDVQTFIKEKNELFRRLNAAGLKVSDEMQVAIMLSRLPESYDILKRILEAQPSLTVLKLCSELTKEGVRRSNKRKLADQTTTSTTSSSSTSTSPPPVSAFSAQDSNSSHAAKRAKTENNKKHCNFCDVKGHTDNKCWLNPNSTNFRADFKEKMLKMIATLQKHNNHE
jgi:hypothetical protein